MKTISYTYMREHLTEVLDDLRNGEKITVTQRGKADLVLSAGINVIPDQGDWRVRESSLGRENARQLSSGRNPTPPSGEPFKGVRKEASSRGHISPSTGNWKEVKTSGKSMTKSSGKGLSFSDAKERTKSRHAGVIKMLGDK